MDLCASGDHAAGVQTGQIKDRSRLLVPPDVLPAHPQVGVYVGKNKDGFRGLYASAAGKEGDSVAVIPSS